MSTSTEPNPTEEKTPIQLDVKVESPHACLREVVVTIPGSEVQRYLKDAYDELVPEAQVPGFRSGRAPRKLVEKQFRDRVVDQVKGSLLMDSLSQVTESQEFSAISEPNFDFESIELPEEGEFKYQFTIEVRPEFKTPDWKGIELKKPVETITDEDVSESLNRVLARYSESEATDEPAKEEDTLLLNATFKDGDKVLSTIEEERVTLRSKLSLAGATCDNFGELMAGVKEGESRSGKVKISDGVSDDDQKGKEYDAEFTAVEVVRHTLPELTDAFLEKLGDFESEEELRSFVRDSLERQAEYRTQQAVRQSIVESLAGSADFELPRDLVQRQTNRELRRKVLEMRSSGFDEEMVQRLSNALRQNAQTSTEAALREHFILEQIAEENEIDAEPADFDQEILQIAEQRDESPRRVRARMEKSGEIDSLRNQIVERKVIDSILESAKVTEEAVEKDDAEETVAAIGHSVLPQDSADVIPEAQHDDHNVPGQDTEKEKD